MCQAVAAPTCRGNIGYGGARLAERLVDRAVDRAHGLLAPGCNDVGEPGGCSAYPLRLLPQPSQLSIRRRVIS